MVEYNEILKLLELNKLSTNNIVLEKMILSDIKDKNKTKHILEKHGYTILCTKDEYSYCGKTRLHHILPINENYKTLTTTDIADYLPCNTLYEGLIKSYSINNMINILNKSNLLKYPANSEKTTRKNKLTNTFIEYIIIFLPENKDNFEKIKKKMEWGGWFFFKEEQPIYFGTYTSDEKNAMNTLGYKCWKITFYPKFDIEVTDEVLNHNNVLYHMTSINNFEKIKKNGLIPKNSGKISKELPDAVYFGLTQDSAKRLYYSDRRWGKQGEYVLLKVTIPSNYKYRFFVDQKLSDSVYTLDNIDPKFIEIIDKIIFEKDMIIKPIIEENVDATQINLKSFESKGQLNPQVFDENEKIFKRLRLRLLDVADDFIDELCIPGVEPEDVVLVGSMAGFSWSRYGDFDIHIIYKFSDIDKRLELLRDYFDSKKSIWNEDKQVKIYGYPVELYVESVEDPSESNGRYSLYSNEWIKYPEHPEPITYQRHFIKEKSAQLINVIDNYVEKFEQHTAAGNDEELTLLSKKCNALSTKIKGMRKFGIARGGEMDSYNIIFKILRRSGRLEKLFNLKNKIYVYNKSIR